MASISLYPHIFETKRSQDISMDIFLQYIQDGKWQDFVLPIRTMDEVKRKEAKKKVPYVTLSGLFTEHSDNGIKEHSGFIGMDFDNIKDVQEFKSIVCCDPYVYAAFVSISGRGLCVIVKINGDKHRDAHAGLSEYFYNNYGEPCDPTSVNPSRARFISFDPDIYINTKSQKFTQYPKNKAPKKVDRVVFAQTDFEEILQDIQRRNLDLCSNYHDWLRIGFALVDKFGEQGRSYFHVVSANSYKYDATACDKQYTNCLKAKGSKQATIATFYYYCKQAGIQTYSQTTKRILTAAVNGKRSGLPAESIQKNLKQFDGVDDTENIVTQVYENNIEEAEEGLLTQLEQWLRFNYSLRKNEITRQVENNGRQMEQDDYNSLFIASKKVMEKLDYTIVEKMIHSNFTPKYNPFHEFIASNRDRTPSGTIDSFWDCILTRDYEYTRKFGKKWLVGIIASIHGEHSPLMIILSGHVHGTGKTEFFRRMLPVELRSYFTDISQGIKDTDLNILMCQKLVLLDDECGNKSKKDELVLKSTLSKQVFSLREPYGRSNVDLQRIAVLCGTTNESAILNDPTGNRRLIPVPVLNINHSDYNKIDKTDLFIEAYHLYKSGFNWRLTHDDIAELTEKTSEFQAYSAEYELLSRWYKVPGDARGEEMTATDIKVDLEFKSNQKLSINKIGQELQRLGFKQVHKKDKGSTKRVYEVIRFTQAGSV